MKICVINGSPKGQNSVTLQTVLYLQKRFPEHSFSFINAGQRIAGLEKDMSAAASEIAEAQLLLFAYPVYTFLAPSQLHRFIELLKRSGMELSGKYATQLTTSMHFYDVTAHRYIEDNCMELGMRVIHGLSADMDDLLSEKGRREAEDFMRYALWCAEKGVYEPAPEREPRPLPQYVPSLPESPKREGYDTVIVADLGGDCERLRALLKDFTAAYPYPTRLVDISQFPFKGGCLGCLRCAGDGKCVYTDGFDSFLRDSIQSADAVVYAFNIKDHCMGSRFKTFDDRQFCNGHRTVTEGKPCGYVVSGDYESEGNLRMVIEARSEVGHNFLAGVGFDAPSLQATAQRLGYALETGLLLPRSFYGVGGMKIFRDLIWLMRGLMKADHEFYKEHGLYDFPQKKRGQMLKMQLLGALVRNPKLSAKMGNKMSEGMVAPYKKVLKELDSAPTRD